MPDIAEPQPPVRRITRISRVVSLETSLLSAALVGGAIGLCAVIGFIILFSPGAPVAPVEARPTAIVVTVTPSPIIPTPTPPPAPTATPTPEGLYVGGHAQVSGTGSDTLRLRSDPGLQSTTLVAVPDGTVLLILDGPRDADGIPWGRWRNLADGSEGWAAQVYLVPT